MNNLVSYPVAACARRVSDYSLQPAAYSLATRKARSTHG
jgi:hypothetical protein